MPEILTLLCILKAVHVHIYAATFLFAVQFSWVDCNMVEQWLL